MLILIYKMSGSKGQNPIVLAQRGLRPLDPQNTSKYRYYAECECFRIASYIIYNLSLRRLLPLIKNSYTHIAVSYGEYIYEDKSLNINNTTISYNCCI